MSNSPRRTCIGCRNTFEKKDVFRVTFFEDKISLDKSGRANGRGAYLCKNKKCVDTAFQKKAFNRAFKKNFSSDEMNNLKDEIEVFLETDLKSERNDI